MARHGTFIIASLVLVLLSGCGGGASQSSGQSSTKDAVAIPAKDAVAIPAKDSEKPKERRGKVVVEITFKYNNFVGHRPDTNAVVILRPRDVFKLPSGESLLFEFAVGELQKALATKGAFAELVSGTGKAKFSKIPVGEYQVVVLSKNTDAPFRRKEENKALLQNCFDTSRDRDSSGVSLMAFKKIWFTDIKVEDGDEVELSHDFGVSGD